jgi:hypothetical protein
MYVYGMFNLKKIVFIFIYVVEVVTRFIIFDSVYQHLSISNYFAHNYSHNDGSVLLYLQMNTKLLQLLLLQHYCNIGAAVGKELSGHHHTQHKTLRAGVDFDKRGESVRDDGDDDIVLVSAYSL